MPRWSYSTESAGSCRRGTNKNATRFALCHFRTVLDVQRSALLRRDQTDRLCRTGGRCHLEEMIVRDLTLPSINQQLVRGPFNLVPGVHRRPGLTAPDEQSGRGAGRSQNLIGSAATNKRRDKTTARASYLPPGTNSVTRLARVRCNRFRKAQPPQYRAKNSLT